MIVDWGNEGIWMFLTVAIIVFGIAMIALGAFSAYFGKGKSRAYGGLMAVIGAIVLAVWIYLVCASGLHPFNAVDIYAVLVDLVYQLVALLIGVGVAAGIFLAAVLKG